MISVGPENIRIDINLDFSSHQVRLGVSVEEEGRQGKALKERQPGLRVHVHWHPSVSRSHSPSFSKEK